MNLQTGTRLGRYEIRSMLGAGGMGGHRPFEGTTAPEIVAAILSRVPAPLAAQRHDTPPKLQAQVRTEIEHHHLPLAHRPETLLGQGPAFRFAINTPKHGRRRRPAIELGEFAEETGGEVHV